MTVFHAGAAHRFFFAPAPRVRRANRRHYPLQILERHRALAQDHGHAARAVHHRGFKTDSRWTAFENAINPSAQLIAHRRPCRGARASGPVGRGSGDRCLARTQECCRNRMRGKSYPDCIKSGADHSRHIRMPRHDQRQRSRKKMMHQPSGGYRYPFCHAADLIKGSHMHNQRIVGRTALGLEYFFDGAGIQGIGTQTVYCFRGKCRQPAAAQDGSSHGWRAGQARLHGARFTIHAENPSRKRMKPGRCAAGK